MKKKGASNRLIVMARYPEPGRVKTRLMPLLGPVGAAHLHKQFVRMTWEAARQLHAQTGTSFEIRSTGAEPSAMASLFENKTTCRDQGEGDLGQRLYNATAEAIASGASRVVLIGTDCPQLTAARINEAFEALDKDDIVLGPATDGGYYLIGLNAAHQDLFTGISWGGEQVLEQTLSVSQRLNLRHRLLAPLSDIDHPEDLSAWATARVASVGSKPWISVIIPTRNEQDNIAATLAAALTEENIELIVADGQSDDRTVEIAKEMGALVATSPPSRGAQLNHGAQHARSDTLLFLHADTILPPDYMSVVQQTLRKPQVAAGAFRLGIDARGLSHRLVEWSVSIRSQWFGKPYGDQALFMTAKTFRACNGFPNLPTMEDYAMLTRLHRQGRIQISTRSVLTSARRWQKHGWLKTTLLHQRLILRYHLGKGPQDIPAAVASPGRPSATESGQVDKYMCASPESVSHQADR